MRTWTYKSATEPFVSPRTKGGSARTVLRKNSNLNPARNASSLNLKSTSKLKLDISTEDFQRPPQTAKQPDPDVFWPLDLLPESCPTIRVLTWGCHTIVTGGKLPMNQNDIFAHAEDLLSELSLIRDETHTIGRPIVFVAHSLGGVIVKEVSQSESQAKLEC